MAHRRSVLHAPHGRAETVLDQLGVYIAKCTIDGCTWVAEPFADFFQAHKALEHHVREAHSDIDGSAFVTFTEGDVNHG